MLDRELISQKMRDHYESVWQQGNAWSLETSQYEQDRYASQLSILDGHRFESVLEIGCGSGQFTCLLADVADRVLALDISSRAIQRAQHVIDQNAKTNVELRVADIMQFDLASADGPWDLIVMSEMIYCLGWLYPFFDVAWLAAGLFEQTRGGGGGGLLLANTMGHEKDWLMCPWLIRTYRDLFLNVGFQLETEKMFRGIKEDTPFEVLMSFFSKLPSSEEITN